MRVHKYDVPTAKLELWKEVSPSDTVGLAGGSRFTVIPDGRTYAYS